MSFKLEITKEPECICITAVGVRNLENIKKIIAEIVQACVKHKRSRIVGQPAGWHFLR